MTTQLQTGNQKATILVVEDEADIREMVAFHLERAGYHVRQARSGESARTSVRAHPPDLIILDLMLPGIDGMDLCRTLKSDPETAHIPIVILTALDEETDIVLGLELGSDDYVTKPFSAKVLLARIKAVLRRPQQNTAMPTQANTVEAGSLVVDIARYLVTVGDAPVQLTRTEFRLLAALAERQGWVLSREQLADAIRKEDEDRDVSTRAIDVHIVNMRKKLGTAAELIETVRGVGYRLKAL